MGAIASFFLGTRLGKIAMVAMAFMAAIGIARWDATRTANLKAKHAAEVRNLEIIQANRDGQIAELNRQIEANREIVDRALKREEEDAAAEATELEVQNDFLERLASMPSGNSCVVDDQYNSSMSRIKVR